MFEHHPFLALAIIVYCGIGILLFLIEIPDELQMRDEWRFNSKTIFTLISFAIIFCVGWPIYYWGYEKRLKEGKRW